MVVRPFRPDDKESVVALWERAGLVVAWNDPNRDIDRKVEADPEGFLVALSDDGELVGSVMAGYDGHRGWINYLAVAPDHQRAGIGEELMAEAEKLLLDRGCPKINLQIRATNAEAVEFYESVGFERDDVISMGKRLIRDD